MNMFTLDGLKKALTLYFPLLSVLLIPLLILLLIASCVSIPNSVKQRTVQNDQTAFFSFVCHPGSNDHVISSRNGNSSMLDPYSISLLNWNVFKGESAAWMQVFSHYSEGQNLITLQEAYLTDNFLALLDQQGLNWDLATTFKKLNYATGVMTASHTAPISVCVQRNMEPWVLLPKATLISVYPLQNRQHRLLLINIHAINFTFGDIAFRNQLIQIAGALIEHKGPVIVAGDFNTWSHSREQKLDDILLEPFALSEVYFNSSNMKTMFKHQLDHVYYRELEVVKNTSELTKVSDHNPMWVTFKYTEENP